MKLREFNKLREWYKFIIVSGDNNNNKKNAEALLYVV